MTQRPMHPTSRRAAMMAAAAAAVLLVCVPSRANAQAVQSAKGASEADLGAWGGFDLNVTLSDSSGLYFGGDGYLNQGQVYLTPTWALGKKLLAKTWAEPLVLSGRFVISAEFAGSDPLHRGSRFASPSLFGDGGATSAGEWPERSIEGAQRQLSLWDLRFDLVHGDLGTIPKVDVGVWAGLRVALPTSPASRSAGLIVSPSLAVGFSRSFGPVSIDLSERVVAYLNRWTTGRIRTLEEPVLVNGKEEEPWRPESTGSRNATWGLVHGFDVGYAISEAFSASASLWYFSDFVPASGSCSVPGVPTADLCSDGAALGDVRSDTQRDYTYSQLSVNWHARPWLDLSFGVSTFRALRMPDGSLGNPFLHVSRDNLSSLWLATSVSGEALWTAFRGGETK